MRVLNFQDGFTSSVAPTGLSINFPSYATDAAFVTGKGSAASAGDAYFNTTFNLLKLYDGTAWRFVGSDNIGIFAFANNQSVATNVTGLLFNGAVTRSVEIDVQFYRNTTGAGATELAARAKYLATYKTVAAAWDLTPLGIMGDVDATLGTPAGVTLTITSSGQVQYVSTNITGTAASSTLTYRADTIGV